MRLSGLSQIITADNASKPPAAVSTSTGTGFEPWMWANILGDLKQGDFDHKSVQYLQTANRLLTRAHKVDSIRIQGYVATEWQQEQLIIVLRDSLSRTDEMGQYWHRKYRRASTERWGWRLVDGLLLYLKLR